MVNQKAKTISLLLESGNLDGIINIESSSWNSGELYSSPRESAEELLKTDACSKYGVYLLLSKEKVYIGQSTDLSLRIKQHLIGKEWWDRVIVLTTSNDTLDHADIDYLETKLISLAEKTNHLDCDNKNKGNKIKVKKFRLVELEQYLEEALFLMGLIGVTVFDDQSKISFNGKQPLIETMAQSSERDRYIRSKAETIKFLESQNIKINKSACTYARCQDNKKFYWMNPRVEYIEKNWDIILNNQHENEIILMRVPKNTFKKSNTREDGYLLIRKDKPIYLDVHITSETFTDLKSNIDFSKYIVKRIKY